MDNYEALHSLESNLSRNIKFSQYNFCSLQRFINILVSSAYGMCSYLQIPELTVNVKGWKVVYRHITNSYSITKLSQ